VRSALLPLLGSMMLALPACTPAGPGAADPDAPVSSADRAPPTAPQPDQVAPGELFGQWRLVALTGARLADSPPLHLLIGQARIEATSQCVPFFFASAFEADGRVAVRALSWPGPVCARGLLPAEETFPRVMVAARRVERRADGRIAFVGPLGEAVIERPAEPVLNPFGNDPGPDPWQMWGGWRLERVDNAMADSPIELNFSQYSVEARSGCVSFLWRLDWGPRGALRLDRDESHAACERGLTPHEEKLTRILDGDVRVEPISPVRRRLAGRAGAVTLVR
jgi:hypothetical protein